MEMTIRINRDKKDTHTKKDKCFHLNKIHILFFFQIFVHFVTKLYSTKNLKSMFLVRGYLYLVCNYHVFTKKSFHISDLQKQTLQKTTSSDALNIRHGLQINIY